MIDNAARDYFQLTDQVAMVTGASSGLGRHFALTLARAGCRVVAAARRREALEQLVNDIIRIGGQAIALPLNVCEHTAIEAAFITLANDFGQPTILVNNAGLAAYNGFLQAEATETDQVFAVNQRAAWDVAQVFARTLVAAKQAGSIINIASITGLRAVGGAASYAITKAALAHLTQIQAFELARHNIRANAIAPGYFDTQLTHDFLNSKAGEKTINRIPMRRIGQMEELEGLLLLLASQRSSFITGAVIPVDGGHLVNSL